VLPSNLHAVQAVLLPVTAAVLRPEAVQRPVLVEPERGAPAVAWLRALVAPPLGRAEQPACPRTDRLDFAAPTDCLRQNALAGAALHQCLDRCPAPVWQSLEPRADCPCGARLHRRSPTHRLGQPSFEPLRATMASQRSATTDHRWSSLWRPSPARRRSR